MGKDEDVDRRRQGPVPWPDVIFFSRTGVECWTNSILSVPSSVMFVQN